jgi:hypothetical protein
MPRISLQLQQNEGTPLKPEQWKISYMIRKIYKYARTNMWRHACANKHM